MNLIFAKKTNNVLLTQCLRMSYYLYNRQENLKKATEKYCKEKTADCYLENKEAIKNG